MERYELGIGSPRQNSDKNSPTAVKTTNSPKNGSLSPKNLNSDIDSNCGRMKRLSNKNVEIVDVESIAACKV